MKKIKIEWLAYGFDVWFLVPTISLEFCEFKTSKSIYVGVVFLKYEAGVTIKLLK